jgi:hypothetical protein
MDTLTRFKLVNREVFGFEVLTAVVVVVGGGVVFKSESWATWYKSVTCY